MTKLIIRTVITLLMLAVVPAFAMSEARLIGQSSTGQTALFNLGSHDGVKEGDFAVIVKEVRSLDNRDLRIVPVAKAKNVKLTTANSVWILYKVYDSELLVKGQAYLMLTESQMLSGRRDPRFGRISVVTEKDKTILQARQALGEDKDRLSKLKDIYPEVQPVHEKETRSDTEGELLDVEGWRKFKNDKYRTALYKSPRQDDFRRELRLSTFEKMVTAYLQKVNDPKFNYDDFYEDQKRTTFANEFREKSSFTTEYEAYMSVQAQKAVENAKLYRSVLEKGGSWSEDFSDEELKVVLKEVSVLQEKDRRSYVMAEPKRYTSYLSYGMNITDAQTEEDSGYRREGNYAVEAELEGTPFLKHETLERITLFGTLRTNKTAFEVGSKNAKMDEVSFSVGANWYFLYPPYAVEAPSMFLGTYIRSGTATVEAPSVNEKANYTVIALPGIRGGLKYNFKNRVGLRIAFNLETLQLDRYEQSKLGSILPDQTDLVEGKLNFAVAYSF